MGTRTSRVWTWIIRYLPAELTGTAFALVVAGAGALWWPGQTLAIALLASIAETAGFYLGFLAVRYLREDLDGPPRRRIVILLAAAVVEFGPSEIADSLLIRPLAMFAGTVLTGHVVLGVLVGKIAADLVFYGLAITSYEVLVRRLLGRFRSKRPAGPRSDPVGPELIMDLDRVATNYARFTAALPRVEVHFAVKCNPDPPLLARLRELGCGFEIASRAELDVLSELGVPPGELIFSNPVKPWWHIRDAYAAGCRRFAADSVVELEKLAEHAPGSGVLIRLAVPGTRSEVPSEGKFGVDPQTAAELLRRSVELGLEPWGLTFHVGSQTTDPYAWQAPIGEAVAIMTSLAGEGIRLRGLDIGGGFPARYNAEIPPIEAFGKAITAALAALPYAVEVLAEPGRGLVAEAGRLRCTVLGIAQRSGRRWVHLDVGAFNGAMEALETDHLLTLPMTDSRGGPTARWQVTGPSCDSQDTLAYDVELSAGLAVGDTVVLHSAGAYTTAYASRFNGFEVPAVRYPVASDLLP